MKTNKIAISISSTFFFALILVSAQQYGMMGSDGQFTALNNGGAGGMMGMMNMMTGYGNYGSGMMFLGWITYLLTITLMIAATYWLIQTAKRKR
ncbi:MAG: hypothetical protein AABW89_02995 [Nanoarchaeota archaeon]